jgi:hypothetical protein
MQQDFENAILKLRPQQGVNLDQEEEEPDEELKEATDDTHGRDLVVASPSDEGGIP